MKAYLVLSEAGGDSLIVEVSEDGLLEVGAWTEGKENGHYATLKGPQISELVRWLDALKLVSEPTELGSVVKDSSGLEWVRVDCTDIPWRRATDGEFENWEGLVERL